MNQLKFSHMHNDRDKVSNKLVHSLNVNKSLTLK